MLFGENSSYPLTFAGINLSKILNEEKNWGYTATPSSIINNSEKNRNNLNV